MKTYHFALFTLLTLAFSSCTKEEEPAEQSMPVQGCTDPDAINYDAEAETDNGTCQFEADLFEGSYLVEATDVWTDPGGTTYEDQDTFSIAITKLTNTRVEVVGIPSCPSFEAIVSETLLTFDDTPCNLLNSLFVRDGDTINFNYDYADFVLHEVTAVATKQ